mmetsp:Transcript_12867/g.38907  ORF Transcript_12867/g.38907 Transcript_12867/m.38907 type:complete len:287 (-) Transcript_12867:251-1111(-)
MWVLVPTLCLFLCMHTCNAVCRCQETKADGQWPSALPTFCKCQHQSRVCVCVCERERVTLFTSSHSNSQSTANNGPSRVSGSNAPHQCEGRHDDIGGWAPTQRPTPLLMASADDVSLCEVRPGCQGQCQVAAAAGGLLHPDVYRHLVEHRILHAAVHRRHRLLALVHGEGSLRIGSFGGQVHRPFDAVLGHEHDHAVLTHLNDPGIGSDEPVLEEDQGVQLHRSPPRKLRVAVAVVQVGRQLPQPGLVLCLGRQLNDAKRRRQQAMHHHVRVSTDGGGEVGVQRGG